MTATDITVHLGMVEFGDTQKLLIGNFPNFIIFSSFVLFFNCTSQSPPSACASHPQIPCIYLIL